MKLVHAAVPGVARDGLSSSPTLTDAGALRAGVALCLFTRHPGLAGLARRVIDPERHERLLPLL